MLSGPQCGASVPPGNACDAGHGVTEEIIAATPGGRCIVRLFSGWLPSGLPIETLNGANARRPGCCSKPAASEGPNGWLLPGCVQFEVIAKLEPSSTAGVPDQGVNEAVVVYVPQ